MRALDAWPATGLPDEPLAAARGAEHHGELLPARAADLAKADVDLAMIRRQIEQRRTGK